MDTSIPESKWDAQGFGKMDFSKFRIIFKHVVGIPFFTLAQSLGSSGTCS